MIIRDYKYLSCVYGVDRIEKSVTRVTSRGLPSDAEQ